MKRIEIVFGIILICFVFMISGCGEIKNSEKVVNEFFNCYKQTEPEKAQAFFHIKENDSKSEENLPDIDKDTLYESMFSELSYKIISSTKVDSKTVIVKTEISNKSMAEVMGYFFQEVMQLLFANAFSDKDKQLTDEELNEKYASMFTEIANRPDIKVVKKEIDIKVIKVDKKWKIVKDDALIDAIAGGMFSFMKEMQDSLNDE